MLYSSMNLVLSSPLEQFEFVNFISIISRILGYLNISLTILGLYKHRVHFFSFFIPSGTPGILVTLLVLIEFISYVARAFSLGVRLFANLVAGHTLLKILSGLLTKLFTSGVIFFILTLIPFSIFVTLCGLEICVSVIQAYV